MKTTHEFAGQAPSESVPPASGNVVAMIGVVLTMAAMLFCGLLFGAGRQLAEHKQDTQASASGSTTAGGEDAVDSAQSTYRGEQLRILLLASVAGVLNLVGLMLCVVGLFVPNRPRAAAIGGVIISVLLLIGVFGVMAVGTLFRV